jgi:hypothetical protein
MKYFGVSSGIMLEGFVECQEQPAMRLACAVPACSRATAREALVNQRHWRMQLLACKRPPPSRQKKSLQILTCHAMPCHSTTQTKTHRRQCCIDPSLEHLIPRAQWLRRCLSDAAPSSHNHVAWVRDRIFGSDWLSGNTVRWRRARLWCHGVRAHLFAGTSHVLRAKVPGRRRPVARPLAVPVSRVSERRL